MSLTPEILAQLPGDILGNLRQADRLLTSLRENTTSPTIVITENNQTLGNCDWDVVLCGGTLGILIGSILAKNNWRVALLERGILRGRDQEWNISRKELEVFLELELLTEVEITQIIASEYNPARIGFLNSPEIWVRDVLNIGVDPVKLLDILKSKFITAGGKLFEKTAFVSGEIHPDGLIVKAGENTFKTRLLIDAMGHFSPIVKQARNGKKPDALCLVVGTCAQGFSENKTGDLFYSFTPLQKQCQYFWEAFPARDGRTTYLFTYIDATPNRLTLEELFTDYFQLLPEYQQVKLEQLKFVRALFGFFPSYRQSPLQLPWHRVLAVGDSSGSQSPLSFGGFGAMLRHLKRLANGIQAALENDILNRHNLALLQPYQPNIAVTWMFQRAMSVGVNQKIEPQQINLLLSNVFQVMEQLGEPVLKPFLQDVIQFWGLFKTLGETGRKNPGIVFKILPQVGVMTLLEWLRHYVNLAVYSGLYPLGRSLEPWVKNLSPLQQYYYYRLLEAWKYGSGGDYFD